jgi:nucleoside 2-deoxyribosyltransferase
MSPDGHRRVFISSTYEDLRKERAAVQKALLDMEYHPIGMELFPSDDERTWEFIKKQILTADVYVVIVAARYGSIAESGVGFTEREYAYAKKIGKPVIAFLRDTATLKKKKEMLDAGAQERLDAFVNRLKKHPVRFFTTPQGLALDVLASLEKLSTKYPQLRKESVQKKRKRKKAGVEPDKKYSSFFREAFSPEDLMIGLTSPRALVVKAAIALARRASKKKVKWREGNTQIF